MKQKEWLMLAQMLGLISQIGLTMIASVVVAFFIGRFLDRILGFSFFLTIFFVILGVMAGFWSIYRLITKLTERKKDE